MHIPSPNSLVTGAACAGLIIAVAVPVQAAVLVDDSFTDVAGSSGASSAGLNAAGWYFHNTSSGGLPWTVATRDVAPLSGLGLRNQGSAAGGSTALRQWEAVTLANVGDSLSVSIDLFANNHTVGDPSRLISVALLGSPTTVSANKLGGTSPLAGSSGYAYGQAFDATTATYNRTTDGTSLTAIGSELATVPRLNNGVAHNLTLTLTRVASGLAVSASVDGALYASYIDTAASSFVFNTLVLRANADWQVATSFDNVQVTFTSAVPEPATAALLLGGAALAGVALMRRRKSGARAGGVAALALCAAMTGDEARAEAEAGRVEVEAVVDLGAPAGRRIEPALFGVAFPRSESHTADAVARGRIAALGAPFVSLSLGGFGRVAAEGPAGPLDWERVDRSLAVIKEVHTGPLQVALGGPRTKGKGGWFDVADPEHRRFWAGVIVQAAKRFAEAGVRAEWWELWIEPDAAWGKGDKASFEHLWTLFNETAAALKDYDPTLKLGGPTLAWPYPDLVARFLEVCGEHAGFVSYHQYGTGRLDEGTDKFMTGIATRYGKEAALVRRLMAERLPAGRELPVMLTEYNMNYGWKPGEVRQQTEVNAVFTTRALLHAAAGGLDKAAIWGAYGDANFGLITPDTGRVAPVAFAMRKLAEWAPGTLLSVAVSPAGGALEAVATVHADRKGYTVILTNGAEQAEASVRIATRGVETGVVTACDQYEVGRERPEGIEREVPLVAQMMEVTVPPMSVVLQRFRFDREFAGE